MLFFFIFQAYKSLNGSDNFVQAGWVKEMKLKKFTSGTSTRFLIIGKVKHSQRLSEKLFISWLVCEGDGEILAGHCTCMAG